MTLAYVYLQENRLFSNLISWYKLYSKEVAF